ncbi:NADPH-dependent FMN reductase [Muriicola sp. Z0-33]|uniref:NADPH-dependent FMN reductase n=1 Tax=Muriicola sp. Z0-33 TaxID=2816957 RepID=UPI0022379497|nr:NAD(P)H-dependent oxidoreductase [Muriicola sp. Z0-33]MCW5515450.1 NAD(P)H-dependent oxidoreductase [Muriicola sp. Z0-33]
MAQILAFAGSNSSTSINYKLVKYTTGLITDHDIQLLNMSNFPFPMYSEDLEKEKGFSNSLVELKDDIRNADGLIISVNEHNGGPSAYYKNLLDWLSRLERKFLTDKKVLLMSCSPGGRGAIGSLEYSQNILPRYGAEIVTSFSLANFGTNFNQNQGITAVELATKHGDALEEFLSKL